MTERDDVLAQLPLHPRDFLILLALADGELHGYGLVKRIEEESEGSVRMDPANLYRSLRRLERDGCVEEVAFEAERGAVDEADERRRYYGLTALGRQVAAAEAARVSRLVGTTRVKRLIGRLEGGR